MSDKDIEMGSSSANKEFAYATADQAEHEDVYDEEPKEKTFSFYGFLRYCRKLLNYQSVRDIQFAFQFTCCFVFAALIAYLSPYSSKTSVPYLLPLMSPLMFLDTFGGTILSTIACIISFVPTCVFVYILMKIGMGYHDYTSTTILFFCTCFILSYVNTTVATRKTALLLPAVFFVTLVNTPNYLVPDDFVWELLKVVLVALCVDLAVSITIFPRFACLEVQDRFSYSLARNQEVLELALSAMLCTQRASAEVYLSEANAIVAHVNANQEVMYARAVPGKVEPVALIRAIFRSKQTVFNQYSIADLSQISAYLTWHVTATVHAAKNTHFNEYHAVACDTCRESFLNAIHQYKDLIRMLRGRVHDKQQINVQIDELKKALDHMHHVLSRALRAADKVAPQDATSFVDSPVPNLSSSTEEGQEAVKAVLFDGDAKKEANRLTFSYFLFHMSELIQTVENKFCTNSEGHVPLMEASIKASAKAEAEKPKATPANIVVKILMLPVVILMGIGKSLATDWKVKAKVGIRTALLMGVAFVFATVPKLVLKFENGQWIMFAMLMSQGDTLGGTFYVMRNRFLGTLMGAVFGYFVFIAVEMSYSHIIGMFVPYLLICGVIKQNKQWGYFGSIGATTALIITFGRIPFLDPVVGDYSLLRIQENVIGILLSLTCTLLFQTVYASDLLKMNIVKVFSNLAAATNTMADAYVKTVTGAEITKHEDGYDLEASMVELSVVEQAKKDVKILFIQPLVTAVKSGISQQPLLIEKAAMETVFWSKALPEATYLQLISCERKVLHMLVTIDRSLLRISKIYDLKAAESFVLFAKSISQDVTTLLEEVSKNLTLWSAQLRATIWNDTSESTEVVVRSNHVRTREEHLKGLEVMDQSSKSIARGGVKFNNELMKEWMDEVFSKMSTDTGKLAATEANIHHMYDILTTFNALFYASSHLAMATSELGNTVFMILLLERKKSHKQF